VPYFSSRAERCLRCSWWCWSLLYCQWARKGQASCLPSRNTAAAAAARRLAQQFDAVFLPLQEPFSKAVAKAPMEYWVWDGIHPTAAGHALLAHEWVAQVSKRWKFLSKIAG